MVHKTIRVEESIFKTVQAASVLNSRSVSGQLAHWVNIGRIIEQSPTFDMTRVEAALKAEIEVESLSPEELEVFHERFFISMGDVTEESEAFYANLAEEAKALGYTE